MYKTTLYIFSLLFTMLSLTVTGGNGDIKYKAGEGLWIDMERFFVTSLPGETVTIKLKSENNSPVTAEAEFGPVTMVQPGKWQFTAPRKSGNYEIVFTNTVSKNRFTLVLFVLVPSGNMKGAYLNGYKIGTYPDKLLKGNKIYKKPEGFIEVTNDNKNIYITPHFRLKQFLCKQQSGWPKYLIIQPKLLIKLEYLLSALNKDGRDIKTLFIMSGYRTPSYNKSLGNVKFSRHMYGDAADVYVDENHDDVIDDLNNDGNHDMKDALLIWKIINSFDNDPRFATLIGGMGKYKKNARHTYFIHVDTRGYRARW